jgi:MFS family permease
MNALAPFRVPLAAALLFGAAPFLGRLPPLPASLALVVLAVTFACAASGIVSAIAIGAGAIGALVAASFGGVATLAGGALIVTAAYAERTLRVRGTASRSLHVGLAAVTGAAAGALVHSYIAASPTFRVVASAMAATLLLVPLLIPADDAVASALEQLASQLPASLRYPLLDTVALRRHGRDVPFDRSTSREVSRTWSSLLRLAEARARLDESRRAAPAHLTGRAPSKSAVDESNVAPPSPADAVAAMLERKIHEHVGVLARAYTAVDAARAATLGLDDAAMRTVETTGDVMDEMSRAMVD